jgi:hypothetical protein
MWTKIKNWLSSLNKSDDEWYLDSAADIYDLEIRMISLQRKQLNDLHNKYWGY